MVSAESLAGEGRKPPTAAIWKSGRLPRGLRRVAWDGQAIGR
jgi:hypothetical protein